MEEEKNIKFNILFWGNYIPLQGIDFIIDAARILAGYSDINFHLVGHGQEYNRILSLSSDLNNISFTRRIDYLEIPRLIQASDLCLGIFGITDKASRVIPNKVYEAMAMKKPIITEESPAARELLTDNVDVLFCKPGDGKDLADKIIALRDDRELRDRIALNAYNLFNSRCSPDVLGGPIIKKIQSII